jgi:Tol biopolymer transport system component
MALSPGARLGAFEIVALVGAGGMGEVYRARDTRLDRTVAIKVLNEAGLGDSNPRRIERFRQEARAVARITHPNICTLYDVAQEGATTFLVMEFVEGTTLARRLEEGRLPLAAALKIAIQIADALDHAHRQGVVHRDLKPSNIMLARDRVKLLDFGLAKLKEPDERVAVVAATATQLTDAHTIVGTVPYMAPEQIEGRDVDPRTDIFSFGIVLYEMLAGRRPFAGDSRATVMAAIVGGEPPSLAGLQPGTPPAVERLVARCLAKDPDDRWQTARDLAAELRWIVESSSATGLAARPAKVRRRKALAAAAAIVIAVAVVALLATRVRFTTTPAPTVARFTIPPPEGGAIASLGVMGSPVAVSPNGRHIAFLATVPGRGRMLYLRNLDGVTSQPLPGTAGASHPFWSPDSESLGFFARNKLQQISIGGGEPQTICDVRGGGGATWNQDGVILFAPAFEGSPLYRVPATGGTPTPVTRLDAARESAHLWPSFLPDGKQFVFARIAGEHSGLYACSLDPCEPKLVIRADLSTSDFPFQAAFAPPRYLVYARRGVVMAQAFDLERLELTGDPLRVVEGVDTAGPAAAFSVSQNGVLAYWSGGGSTTQLTWVDRAGQVLGTAAAPGPYRHVALSPDGAHAAVDTGAASGIQVVDIRRGAIAPLVAGIAISPVWSPDGDAILFSAARDTPPNLFLKRLNAPGDGERLVQAPIQQFPLHWSPDGQSVVYARLGPETRWDLWVLPMAGDRSPTPFLSTPANETLARISPDGQWIAYQSDESGRYEVYVTSYPQPGRRWPASVNGGTSPTWRKDGREMYYDSADHRLMAVPVGLGPIFTPGVPVPLFALRAIRVVGRGLGWSYDVAPDGRFLVNTLIERSAAPLTVVLNWPTGVGKD